MRAPRDHMQPRPPIVNVGPQLFHSPQAPSAHPPLPPTSHQPLHPSRAPPPPSSHHHTSHQAPSHYPHTSYSPLPFAGGQEMEEPSTVPLEPLSVSPKLAATLEHIVGQLDVLTQVMYMYHIFIFFC